MAASEASPSARRRGGRRATLFGAAALVAVAAFGEVYNHRPRVLIGAGVSLRIGLSDHMNTSVVPDKSIRVGCSCLTGIASSSSCCQRAVLTSHKFGWVLTARLFRPFADLGVERRDIHPSALPASFYQDYRHVVVARNFLDAIVSGYLYHKSGRECWLTFNGGWRPKERVRDWDPYLNHTQYDIKPYPPRDGRSICRYVADESEEVGMRVYMAVALGWWYSGLDDYYRTAQESEARHGRPRTLVLCLHDFPDPQSQDVMFRRAMDWLHPGGHNFTAPPGAITTPPAHGGHSPPRNETERRQLLLLVRRLDREVFNGAIGVTDSLLGCRGEIHRGGGR